MNPKIMEYLRSRGLLPDGYDDAVQEQDSANQANTALGWAKVAGQMADGFANANTRDIILKNKRSQLGSRPEVIEARRQKTDFSLADSFKNDRMNAAKSKLEQIKEQMKANLGFAQDQDKLESNRLSDDNKLEFDREKFAAEQINKKRELDIKEREAGAKGKEAAGPNKDALSMFDKYNLHPTTKNTNSVREAYGKVQKALSNPNAANDMAGIFGYMKMLDPGSSVREGEFANAENAAGVPQRIISLYNSALTGQRLSPAQRLEFMKSAEQQLAAQEDAQKSVDKHFRDFAQSYGYPTDNIIPGSNPQQKPNGLTEDERAELEMLEKRFGSK